MCRNHLLHDVPEAIGGIKPILSAVRPLSGAMKIIAAIFAYVAASFLVALIGIRCYKPIAVWSQSLRSQLHTVFV